MESTITKNYSNNDNASLLAYQDEYLRTGSADAWGKMFALSVHVCRNIIDSRCRKKNLIFDDSTKEDYSMNAAIYVLRRFKEGCRKGREKNADQKPYHIDNFITSLNFGVTHALYCRTPAEINYERAASLDAIECYLIGNQNVENDTIDILRKEKIMQLIKAAFSKKQ